MIFSVSLKSDKSFLRFTSILKSWVNFWSILCLALILGLKENNSKLTEAFKFLCFLLFFPRIELKNSLLDLHESRFLRISFLVYEKEVFDLCVLPVNNTTFDSMLKWQSKLTGWVTSLEKKKGNNWNSVNYCNDCKIFAIMNIWTANVLRVNSSTCLSFEMSYFSPSFSIWLLRVTLSFLVSFTLQRHVV